MEEWKDIIGYEGLYQVSNYGRVKNNRNILLNGSIGNNGYYKTTLTKSKIKNSILFHRLVAIHFISNPENKRTVNHKDGNKLNNHVNNLEWNSDLENIHHANDIGLIKFKLTEKDVLEIRSKYIPIIYTQKMLAEEYGVSNQFISVIINRKKWTHL